MPAKLAFSAPGKAFLAGGYLVLDPAYSAYVVALSARMHAIIQSSPVQQQQQDGHALTHIKVTSPQFAQGTWEFSCDLTGPDAFKAKILNGNNPFLEATITVLLSYIEPTSNQSIEITVYSDDAYHSQEPEELAKNPTKRFHHHSQPISQVPKTGLGSSAALVSVVTAAILSYYKPELTNDLLSNKESLKRIHNLAQLAHCAAQKKIGSGFDVASAVCGSIIYSRFPASTLGDLTSFDQYPGPEYAKLVQKLVDTADWGVRLDPCVMPPGLSLLMGDVCGGSETPKLVSTVLQWRKEKPDYSLQVWTELNHANMELVKMLGELQNLSVSAPEGYAKLLQQGATASSNELAAKENQNHDLLQQLSNAFKGIRKNLKVMTVDSGAAIEPDSQTQILDRCYEIPGVLGGVVPGAGGYDAICLLVATSAIETIKSQTQTDSVLKNVVWLDLHEDNIGLRQEELSVYDEC